MIVDEFVEIKWHSTNKKYLSGRGYVYTKIGESVLIKINDLKMGSHVIIHAKCDVCGKEKQIIYKAYNKNIKSGGYYGCSNECSINKQNNTNLKRYGFKNVMRSDIIKNKLKKTNLERYGVVTNLLHEDTINKSKKTNQKKYGVDHNSQSSEIKEKKKQTSVKKYGVDSYFKTNEFKKKTKETNLEKFGTENPAQNIDVKEKIKKTCLERYGEIWLKHVPNYNPNSIMYLDVISKKSSQQIRHALNGGEKKFVRYWVDGYIDEYNICIEWDERYHSTEKQIEMDLKRETFLIENFNCSIIRINEKEFLCDIENQTNIIVNSINKIKEKYGK